MTDETAPNEERADAGRQETQPPTILGWAVRIASALALFGLLALLGYKAIQPNRPTVFTAEAQREKAYADAGAGVLVPVEITNTGTGTVHNVDLVVTDGTREHDVEIERIGENETRIVVLRFDRAPERLETRIDSYSRP
ncbi:hypothetical protein [Tsuneonella sp. SYSU-LHT278]|uniref:hypothetical protein n=1 Tax=Tsuneonella sediminis TaxID=3416089 RepID=UPI003F79541E